jgi:hypothetical protein
VSSPSATEPSVAATPSTTVAAQPDGGGTITFKGKVTGTMTVSACPGGGVAQLTVDVDGENSTYTGVIDADDFTFIGPGSTAYTLAKGASKPQISGQTYTVKNTKLVGVTDEGTVTATGSVTCP